MRRKLIRVMLQVLAVIGTAELGQYAAIRALEGMLKPIDVLTNPARSGQSARIEFAAADE